MSEKIIKRINYFIFKSKVAIENCRIAEMRSNHRAATLATETKNKYECAALDLAKQYNLLDHEDLSFNNN
jgi:hypothetical protein